MKVYKSVYEIRYENLEEIKKEYFLAHPGSSERRMAESLGVDPSQFNLAKGKRQIGDALARKLEAGAGKPENWMDNRHRGHDLPEDLYRVLSLLKKLSAEDWSDALRWVTDKILKKNNEQ